MRRYLLPAALVAAVVALALPGIARNTDDNSYRDLRLFGEVLDLVRQDYVEPVNEHKLVGSAINGMLSALDPHSSYMDPESYQAMRVETRGEFGGLGMEVTMKDGLVQVVAPIDDTPASKAGIKAGDVVLKVDGLLLHGLSLSDAVGKMRGPIGSKVTLTVRRGSEPPFDVSLVRANIKVPSVRAKTYGDIGYIRIAEFTEQTDAGVQAALDQVRREAKPRLAGLVIDLRNNPGGLLDQAIAVANDFLDQGEIVSTRGRRSEDDHQYYARNPGDLARSVPIVVLINGGSASASEIVAGALHDHHRARLVGTRTFGKGTVQTIIPLPNNGAIRLTTARYYTPSGRSIQDVGIEPDIVVEQGKSEPFSEVMPLRERDLPGALKNPNAPPQAQNQPAPPAGKIETPPPKPSAKATGAAAGDLSQQDYQLSRAIDLLHGVAMLKPAAK